MVLDIQGGVRGRGKIAFRRFRPCLMHVAMSNQYKCKHKQQEVQFVVVLIAEKNVRNTYIRIKKPKELSLAIILILKLRFTEMTHLNFNYYSHKALFLTFLY